MRFSELWGNGFLPSEHQGTYVNHTDLDPVRMLPYLRNPDLSPTSQRRQLDLLQRMNTGHLADRGLGQWVSGLSLLLMLGSWLPIAFTQSSLWALLIGVITLDLGLQAVHVTSQSMIYSVRPQAQSRLTAGYMLFYSIGSAVGSIASTAMYAWAGWPGVCWLGAGINMAAP